MTDLSAFDALSQAERRAWEAWFAGGFMHVTQYADEPDDVFFGKAECEWVPFTEFWLGKAVDLEWITAEIEGTGIAQGKAGKPEYTKYYLRPTQLGMDVKGALDARFAEAMRKLAC